MSLGPPMADIRVNNRKGVIINSGSFGKMKILKSGFPYAKEDQTISNGYN